MNKTELSNIIYDDKGCMLIQDTSVYNSDLPIQETYYYVTQPNFSTIYKFNYKPLASLQIVPFNFESKTLPDGVYTIIQKTCDLSNTKYHLRTICLKNAIIEEMLKASDCKEEIADKEKELYNKLIELDIASAYIQDSCGTDTANYRKGIFIFNTISKEINKLKGDCSSQSFCKTCK